MLERQHDTVANSSSLYPCVTVLPALLACEWHCGLSFLNLIIPFLLPSTRTNNSDPQFYSFIRYASRIPETQADGSSCPRSGGQQSLRRTQGQSNNEPTLTAPAPQLTTTFLHLSLTTVSNSQSKTPMGNPILLHSLRQCRLLLQRVSACPCTLAALTCPLTNQPLQWPVHRRLW